MGYDINPARVRKLAHRYDEAAAPLANFDFVSVNVSGETFGDVELAAWFSAVAQQFDEAGGALHDGTAELAENLRTTAYFAEQTDDHASTTFTSPAPGLGGLLDPSQAAPPQTGPYGGI